MPIFHGLQAITLEIHRAVEIKLMECLHGDFTLAMVLRSVMLAVEMEVMFDRTARILSLLVLARRDRRSDGPVEHEDGDRGDEPKEDRCVFPTTYLASKRDRYYKQEENQEAIGEAVISHTVCRKRCIFDCWELPFTVSQV